MKTILIAEDQYEVRELVQATLNIGPYVIIQAENGVQAVEMAHQHRPDLVLMDVMMPGEIDGLEATRRLRASQATKDCRIIMLTAKGQLQDKNQGLEAGADDYFTKPFSPLALIRKVEEYLG